MFPTKTVLVPIAFASLLSIADEEDEEDEEDDEEQNPTLAKINSEKT